MHSQSAVRVEKIKSRILEGKTSLSQLKAQLSNNTDKHVNELLRQAAFWFDDMEVFYLGMLAQEKCPPRTLQQEAFILDQAGFFLERVAMPQVKTLQDLVDKFGPNLEST